jgi:tetratricopeptide (TPR) repeat protein
MRAKSSSNPAAPNTEKKMCNLADQDIQNKSLMRKILLPIAILCLTACYAQDETLSSLVKEGVALHDKGDYDGAIARYDAVIAKDKTFYLAYYEKSFTLFTSGKYQDCIDWCKGILQKFPDGANNDEVYVNYGSALDALGKPDEAMAVYTKGIKKYPGFYLLPFNKAITEYNAKSFDDALVDLKHSVSLNPQHASSHMFLAYSIYSKNKIAALLALSTFLLLEPEGKRAEKNLPAMLQILSSGVQQKDDKNVTITVSPDDLNTKTKGEDDFHQVQLMLTMRSALDHDDKYKNLPVALNLKDKLELIADMLGTETGKKAGFFTRFYIPFYKEMKNDSLLETACYIMLSSSGDAANKKWLEENKDQVDKFKAWLKSYVWAKDLIFK